MDDIQVRAVLVAFAASVNADGQVRRVDGLVEGDMGDDVRVMAGDQPAQIVLEREHIEVTGRGAHVHRAELAENPRGLSREVSRGLLQHHARPVLEEHP